MISKLSFDWLSNLIFDWSSAFLFDWFKSEHCFEPAKKKPILHLLHCCHEKAADKDYRILVCIDSCDADSSDNSILHHQAKEGKC